MPVRWSEAWSKALRRFGGARSIPPIPGRAAPWASRRAANEALRASEEKFAAAFALSPQAISITAIPSGVFIDVNEALVRFSGYARDELLGQTPVALGLWADAEEWERGREALLREGRLAQREVRFRRKDGTILVGLAAGERIAIGGRPAILTVVADITARREVEEGLRRSEERYRVLVESIAQGVCILEMIYGPDGRPTDYRFLEVNPTFERHTGLRDAVGKTARELVPGLEDHWVEIYGRVAETGIPHRFEQGSEAMGRWFEVEAVRVGGDDSRRVALFFTDATERRRVEEALRASEERLQLALSAARAGAWQWEIATQHMIWSPEHFDLVGLPRGASERQYDRFLDLVHPADRQRVREAFTAVATRVDPIELEFRVVRADGAERWLGCVGRVERDAAGVPVLAVGINQDITERRQAEERIALLGEVSALLAGLLDEEPALQALAHLLVRDLADWCLVSTLEPDGRVHRRAFAHTDPASETLLRQLPADYPYDPAQRHGVAAVISSGQSLFNPVLSTEQLAEGTVPPNLPIVQALPVSSGMIVPLRARGRTFGAISLLRANDTRSFQEADLALVEQIADRAAVALDSARLYTAERRGRAAAEQVARRQAAQAEAARLFAEAGPRLEPLLAATARYLVDLLGDGCVIGLVGGDGERIELAAADHRDPEVAEFSRRSFLANPMHVGVGIIGGAVASGQAALHPVVDQEGLLAASEPGLRPVLERFAPRSLMAAPCRAGGRTIGVIAVARHTPGRPYTDDDLALLSDLANRAALAIERARLYDAERRAREAAEAAQARLALLADAGVALARSLDAEATLASLASLIVPGFADWCTINLIGEDGQILPIARHADPARQPALNELLRRYPADLRDNGPLAQVLITGEPLLLIAEQEPPIRAYAPDEAYVELLTRVGLTSTIIVPLLAQQRLLGALRFARMGDSSPYTADDLRLAEEVARRAALALDNARLYRESRDAIAARDRFLSIAAHELRTPVTSVRAYAQLARRRIERGQLSPELVESALSSIERGTSRLNTLIQDLLDVARLQAGQMRIDRAPLDLAALVETVTAEAQVRLPAELTLTVEGTSRPYRVDGDAGRLEQVLGNLLENARNYSPDGGTIAVALAADERGATVTVRDEGIGFAPGEEQSIFIPFNRSEEALRRQIQGLGLGLAISRAIVEQHGGTLQAASAGQGRGTVFTLWLPAAPDLADTAGGPADAMVAEG